MASCRVCGKETLYHHIYCEGHYPQKLATIKQLKGIIRDKDKEIHRMQQRINALQKRPKR